MTFSRFIAVTIVGLVSALRVGAGITPVPLPNPRVSGFVFPESEATVLGWVTQSESGSSASTAGFNSMYLHAWGLWTALTMQTSQVDTGQRLRVYETWYTPQELSAQPHNLVAIATLARERSPLVHFNQFQHGALIQERALPAGNPGSDTVFGYVKFDPTAANHIITQNLLSLATLNQLMQSGAQQILTFPNSALSLKSAYTVCTQQSLVDGRYYRLNVWTGPPPNPRGYPPDQWPGVVWIDMQNKGSGSGEVDLVASTDGSSRTDATTYPVSSMINHQLTALEAYQFNQEDPGASAQAGDYAVLVAMHVAGREIARWTWQSFWWTPTPNNPQFPSSAAIAAVRPPQLAGAARNYAMTIAYDMVTPGQPDAGGTNSGRAIYAYNPYLEARFGPSNLPDSQMGLDPNGQPASNNTGVQCNCMSCHARANYNPNNLGTAPKYTAARYSDLDDPDFAGTLQVDLLWSLPEIAQ